MLIFEPLTVVAQDEEAAAAEVTVELDEDLVRSAVHRLQSCVPTELPNLWWALVWSIPVTVIGHWLQTDLMYTMVYCAVLFSK